MKFFKLRFLPMMLIGSIALIISGCGDSSAGNSYDPDTPGPFPPDKNETEPLKNMTAAQAKDTMAMHAAIYPILAPVAELSNCLTSTDALKQCLKDALDKDIDTTALSLTPGETYPCTKKDTALTYGSFKYDKDDTTGTVTYTFSDTCADYSNSQDLHRNLIMKSCLIGLEPRLPVLGTPTIGTYRIEYRGSVTCSPGKKTGNYSYRTIGNSNTQTKSEWQYNGSLAIDAGTIAVDGSIRGMSKYAVGTDTPDTPWEELFLGSDEEWSFESDTSVTLGNDFVLNGKAKYIKHPNEWEGDRGEGYEFYMAFESLTYNFLKNGRDITSAVKGKASASCHPDVVTYATATTMEDVDLLRDSTHHRMPSSGEMSSTLKGYNPASVTFNTSGNTAQATVTTGDIAVDYDSWKSIIDGSSCETMNTFLDKLPKPPVKNPTPGEILLDNLVFDNIDKRVLSADKMSMTGVTAGSAVWYHLAREQGYTDGQTVAETSFSLNIDMPASAPSVPLVNVYLYDENGTEVRENIYSDADWVALQNDPVKKNWVIRTDYMEGAVLDGVFYQGNFILRIGNSDYSGTGEAFAINRFIVKKI